MFLRNYSFVVLFLLSIIYKINQMLLQHPRGRGPEPGAEGRARAREEDGQQRSRAPARAGHQRGVQGAGPHVSAAPEERETPDQAAGAAPGRGRHPQHGAASQR